MMLDVTVSQALLRLTPGDATCLVAVSGGNDSIALLDLLHRGAAVHGRSLVVGHVDHGIDPSSGVAVDLVRQVAQTRGLRVVIATCALGPGASETRARTARRAALRALARDCGATAIVLAHHADDQAETVLLRLLRGSGPAGLAAMAPRRGPWVRPLLALRRADLARHVAAAGLVTWADPANSDPRHLRSWLRHAVTPVLTERLPDVVDRLGDASVQARNARVAADATPELIEALEWKATDGAISVAAAPLTGYRSPVRDALLAAIARRLGVTVGRRRLGAVVRLLRSGATSGRIDVARSVVAELAFGRLTFHQAVRSSFGVSPLAESGSQEFGSWRISVRPAAVESAVTRSGLTTALVPGPYTVRPWAPGDRIRPLGGTGSRAVSTLLREALVPPRRRRHWPVVVSAVDATIVWVPGICRSEAMVPQPGTEGLHVDCTDA
ncbi:MAG: tRNA lysidine(34) synthetase TilS [Gemmatimonadales bacterium]|nr:tRNA lysidine(34) synthetase TilS [Gemmatimonadales bacterium]